MNFKKFISGMSALAVASSVFAGLAVTASANKYSSPYTLTESEEYREVLIGKATTGQEGKITAVEPQDFDTDYVDSGAFDKKLPLRSFTNESIDESKNLYGVKNGIAPSSSNAGYDVYKMKNVIDVGKLIFRGDITNPLRSIYVEILGEDASGEEISVFKIQLSNGDGEVEVSSKGETKQSSGHNMKVRGYGITIDKLIINMDAATPSVDFEYDAIRVSPQNHESFSGNYEVEGLEKITALKIGNAYQTDSQATIDNVLMYSVRTPEVTDPVYVKCVGDNNEVLSEPQQVTGNPTYIGDSYSYSPYAYIYHNGAYYKYEGVEVDGSVKAIAGTAGNNNEEIVVKYTKANDVVWYTELDATNYTGGHSPFEQPAANSKASGGMNGGALFGDEGRLNAGTFTATVSGTYKISYNAVSATSSTRYAGVGVDVESNEGLKMNQCAKDEYKMFEETVHMDKGDHEIRLFSNGSSVSFYVDYMVIELVESDPLTVPKAFTFDTITAEDGVKTVKVTVDDVEKTGTIDLTGILGDLKLAILITDIPADATTVTAVIE